MSILATAMVWVAAPFEVPRQMRTQYRREWISLWSGEQLVAPDILHGRAFSAWLRAGYPLLATMAIATWVVDSSIVGVTPVPFFAGLFLAVFSTAFHFGRSMMNVRRATLAAQIAAGWPQELLLGVVATGLAQMFWGQ